MAKEYIERGAALELLDGIYDCNDMVFEKNDSCVGLDCGSCRWRDTKNYIRDRLSRIPAADVVPVRHGRWAQTGYDHGLKVCECSVCKKRAYGSTKFCSNCGARMDGDGE